MLTFLNILLAGGLAAVSAPIIIHLLHRSKVVPYEWGAMLFLEELIAERARRIRLRELLLLLVRMALVGSLALALMRPVVKWARSGVRSPHVHTSSVILLDDSYSMNAGRPRSAWREARELALHYVDTLQKGDDATVLFLSSAGRRQAAALFDLDRVREIIKGAKIHYEKADMQRALTAALQQLSASPNPQRELVVFSDMHAAGWELHDRGRWSYLAGTVRAASLPPNIVLASVAERCPCNAAVTALTASRAVVDCFSPVRFNFTVANECPEALANVTAAFSVDGAPKTSRTLSLAAAGQEVLSFEHQFERPGSHYVSCKLRCPQDTLEDDDELLQSVLVMDSVPVLLVDGGRGGTVLAGEGGFLRCALAPVDRDEPSRRSVIAPTLIDSSALRDADLSRYRVVVLANVAALPGAQVSDLERFVVAGGGLLVALGDKVHAETYNRDLYRQGSGLLPLPLERACGGAELQPANGRDARAPGAVHFGSLVYAVPALSLFSERGQDWSKAAVRRYFSTTVPANREDINVLASFSNGQAALAQKKLGDGKVILLTTAVNMRWSDLPVHPFFVPLMQNLVLDLASAVIPPRNLQVGQALSYVAPGDKAEKPCELTPPKGEPAQLKAQKQGSLGVFSYENTEAPGLYTLALAGGKAEDAVYYAVTADREESALARLKKEDYQQLERDLGAKHASDWNSLARCIGLDAGGYEISVYLIMAAVALCFFEIWLTRRWA